MNRTADILAIDDEQVILDGLIKICSLEKYVVDSALNVQSAIEKIAANEYPIVLCDIMMPDGDGFQILEELKNRDSRAVLIMMTGYSTVENAVNSLYQGAVDFIPKPFTVDELLGSLYRAHRYQEIKEKQAKRHSGLLFVPCPARYLRLGYSSWVYQENEGNAVVGVCDLFLKTIESVKEIELLAADEEIAQGTSCAVIRSGDDRIHKILSPVSGRIIEVNKSIRENPSIVEKDPYFEGWIYRVIPTDIDYETRQLLPYSSDKL